MEKLKEDAEAYKNHMIHVYTDQPVILLFQYNDFFLVSHRMIFSFKQYKELAQTNELALKQIESNQQKLKAEVNHLVYN